MSMFRKPGDSSSSSSEASYDRTEDDEPEASRLDTSVTRVNTLNSNNSEVPINARPSLAGLRGFSTQDMQALGFHALLEQNAIEKAAARLHVEPTNPEAQRQGREAYQGIVSQLPDGIDSKYAGDDYRALRSTMQDGINQTTSAHLNAIAAAPPDTQTLIMRHKNGNAVPVPQSPLPGVKALTGLSAPAYPSLRGYPDLQHDRYVREFLELEIVGKGGYGRVYKAKHKLDGGFYAVKRIAIPPAKLAKVQQHGPDALNSILEEVRSLAKFDHANIVRYHNAWLEFATAPAEKPSVSTATVLPNNRLLEDPANFSTSPSGVSYLQDEFNGIQFGEPTADSGADILFEASNTGETDDLKDDINHLSLREQLSFKRKNRRSSQASQATIATLSSTRSRRSAVEDVSQGFEGEDVEMILRRHMPSSQDDTTDASDDMISHSDMLEGSLVRVRPTGPVLTLNVQMSLYESNLAAFLSQEKTSFSSKPGITHCFHPCVSLELLSHILSGVEYLHDQGVVHRDLKPANIFLSLSTSRRPPGGSVNLSTCKPCPKRDCVHIVPRIGDFGLVATLDEKCSTVDPTVPTKAVGTEFYRPDTSTRNSEKLDVFALGVIAVEMLCSFSTRMERSDTLSRLKKGEFPDGFAKRVGPHGDKMQQLIGAMVLANEEQRMSVDEARSEIANLVEALRA